MSVFGFEVLYHFLKVPEAFCFGHLFSFRYRLFHCRFCPVQKRLLSFLHRRTGKLFLQLLLVLLIIEGFLLLHEQMAISVFRRICSRPTPYKMIVTVCFRYRPKRRQIPLLQRYYKFSAILSYHSIIPSNRFRHQA